MYGSAPTNPSPFGKRSNCSTVPKFTNPLFQYRLVVSLDPGKNDSHIAVRTCVSDPSKSRKVFACMSDPDPNFCSCGKSLVRRHTAAIQAQVGDSPLKLNFRLQISYFNAGHERIATSARTFDAHGCRFVCAIGHALHSMDYCPQWFE